MTRTLLLQEDDCAPDAYATFRAEFEFLTGQSFADFLTQAKREEEETGVVFTHGDLVAEHFAEDPFWSVYRVDKALEGGDG